MTSLVSFEVREVVKVLIYGRDSLKGKKLDQ